MYQMLTFYHSLTRWLVLLSLLYAIYKAYKGYNQKLSFTKTDNSIRHWTATIAHIQLTLGILLYIQSPLSKYFWQNTKQAFTHIDVYFFALIHALLMLTAIVIITIGSALSKRRNTDAEKFKTMLTWFICALLIIFIAIPWPFSPLATRPLLR